MVARTYRGLGPPDVAVARFDSLAPHVAVMLGLRAPRARLSPDDMAIALDGLETPGFHFTRRARFFGGKSDACGPLGASG